MKILSVLILALAASAYAQTVTPAPASCPAKPYLKVSWNQTGVPGVGIAAYCVGGSAGCGTPAAPGVNGWLQYSINVTTATPSGLICGLAYGAGGFVSVNFTSTGGGASGWTALTPFQVGQAPPPPVSPLPTGVTVVQQ